MFGSLSNLICMIYRFMCVSRYDLFLSGCHRCCEGTDEAGTWEMLHLSNIKCSPIETKYGHLRFINPFLILKILTIKRGYSSVAESSRHHESCARPSHATLCSSKPAKQTADTAGALASTHIWEGQETEKGENNDAQSGTFHVWAAAGSDFPCGKILRRCLVNQDNNWFILSKS